MDLVILVLVVAFVGFLVWLITTKIPMPQYWPQGIQILALILILLFILRRFGVLILNVL